MDQAIYEALAYALRYWFIFITLAILIAVIYISYKEYNEKKYVKGTMQNYLGYLEIIGGPDDFIGDRFGIRKKNIIGSSKKADIILPDYSVLKTHALLYMEGDNLILSPTAQEGTAVNGRKVSKRRILRTGDTVLIGDIEFVVYIKRTRLKYDS